jgi:hypothetical protein
MLIKSLEEMEDIVCNRDDLEWDGWNVVRYTVATNAIYSKDGCFRNGLWMKKKVYPLTERGWNLPNGLRSVHAQVEE